MTKNLNTDVLIVGAGPTGLMAANQLMRFDVDFIIIDAKEGPTKESRAIAVTARSLEIYQQMGLAQNAITNGKTMTSFNLYSRGKPRAQLKIGEIGKGLSEFSYMLAFEQSKNESLLNQNLISNAKSVCWGHEFIELTEHDQKINALVKCDKEEINIHAQYVIGCEGANSPIRRQLNFSFKGGTYEQKFFVADTVVNWNLGYDKLIVSPGDHNFCAFLPISDDRSYRVIGTLPKAYADSEDITFGDIEDVVINTLGVDMKFESVKWFSVYKLHHRGVDHFSEGRVFLAGDSAHIHSPAGGQGMNTGLQDAYNLCWKLALVIKAQANSPLLETYNEERLPFAKWLLNFTDRGFTFMTSTNWFIKIFRKYVALVMAGIVLRSERIRPKVFKIISQIGYSYYGLTLSKSESHQKLLFKAGERLPYFSGENIYSLFTKPSFHLLHINIVSIDTEMIKEINAVFPFTIEIVEEKLTDKWKKLGVINELFVLVRPDNYIAYIFDYFDEIKIRNYLKRYFN